MSDTQDYIASDRTIFCLPEIYLTLDPKTLDNIMANCVLVRGFGHA